MVWLKLKSWNSFFPRNVSWPGPLTTKLFDKMPFSPAIYLCGKKLLQPSKNSNRYDVKAYVEQAYLMAYVK